MQKGALEASGCGGTTGSNETGLRHPVKGTGGASRLALDARGWGVAQVTEQVEKIGKGLAGSLGAQRLQTLAARL